jgi:peroxiredoxin
MLATADKAPAFELEDTQGRVNSLKDLLQDGPVLAAFFKVSCPVCQYTFPFLERLSKSTNIQVIGISQDKADAAEQFREEYGITFPTLIDPAKRGYAASNDFGITHVPSMFLIQPDGEISMSWSGWSRRDMEALGTIAGVQPFGPKEAVPDWKAG